MGVTCPQSFGRILGLFDGSLVEGLAHRVRRLGDRYRHGVRLFGGGFGHSDRHRLGRLRPVRVRVRVRVRASVRASVRARVRSDFSAAALDMATGIALAAFALFA